MNAFLKLRERLGLTQQQAAAAIGVTQPTIFNWEHGVTMPAPQHWAAIGRVYGISAERLSRLWLKKRAA